MLWLPLPSHRARPPGAGTRAQRWQNVRCIPPHSPCPGTRLAANTPWRLSTGPGRGQEACVWGLSACPLVWRPPSTIPTARACLVGSLGHAASVYAKPGYPQCTPTLWVRWGPTAGTTGDTGPMLSAAAVLLCGPQQLPPHPHSLPAPSRGNDTAEHSPCKRRLWTRNGKQSKGLPEATRKTNSYHISNVCTETRDLQPKTRDKSEKNYLNKRCRKDSAGHLERRDAGRC